MLRKTIKFFFYRLIIKFSLGSIVLKQLDGKIIFPIPGIRAAV